MTTRNNRRPSSAAGLSSPPGSSRPRGSDAAPGESATAESTEIGGGTDGDVQIDGATPTGAGGAGTGDWQQQLAGALAFLRRRLTGDYSIDEFGYDQDFHRSVVLPPLRLLYERWFRVEVQGMQHIPDTGGALIVANHSGTIPMDAAMLTVATHDHHPQHRPLRTLAANLVFDTPVLGPLTRKAGGTLACNPDAERLLGSGELVSVFPEGFKGVGKPFRQRYRLQRFGRGGFVAAALKMRTPIVPCSIVGAEEIYPMVGNIPQLARVLGLPYLPVTPTFPLLGPLGALPLPSKWLIEFGEPILTDEFPAGAAEDPMVVFNLTDRVREVIQQSLYRLLLQRGHPFLG